MTVDGSPLAISGKAKPFGTSRGSVVNIGIHRLDLTQYTDYVPLKLPVKLAGATLWTSMQVSFIEATDKPEVRVAGLVGVNNVNVRDAANAPLVEMKALQVVMNEVAPFNSIIHLSSISIDSLTPHLVLNHDGTTNLTPILKAPPSSPGASASCAATDSSPSTISCSRRAFRSRRCTPSAVKS